MKKLLLAIEEVLERAVPIVLVLMLLGIGLLVFESAPDSVPDSTIVPASTTTTAPPQEDGYSGAPDTSTVTPLGDLMDAAASIEQAHEGLGNVITNNVKSGATCDSNCETAIKDAVAKNRRAWHEVQSDVLDLHTWDNNQTVGHAFDSADYWLVEFQASYQSDFAYHAEYQLGILRDVLNAEVKKRQGG